MRRSIVVLVSLLIFASSAYAKDVWVSVVGSVVGSSVFRTDSRVFNPSPAKDITIDAYFMASGNHENQPAQKQTFTVTKRQMRALDDVVSTLFQGSGLGAILFTSNDDFEVTTRIYADKGAGGTLGQFVPGLQPGQAMTSGALLQLRNVTALFHTNIGAVNPSNTVVHVTWRLYDRNNAEVASRQETMPAYAVISPQPIASYFNPGTADLSEAWVSYTADHPIFAYGSVSDDRTADPTFIPATTDSGASQATQPSGKTFDVTLRTSSITFNPQPNGLAVGDVVTLHIHGNDTNHGFQLNSPTLKVVVAGLQVDPGATVDRTFTVTETGTFSYFCTNTSCSPGHNAMYGTFKVGDDDDDPYRGY